MRTKLVPALLHKPAFFWLLLVLTGLCSFLPAPFYRTFTREHKVFTTNADLMDILKRSSYSAVHNNQAYFYFSDATHYITFRHLSLDNADSVMIRYRAYPMNSRSLFARPVLNMRFEDKNNPGTFLEGRGLRGSYRTRTVRTSVPKEADVHLFISTGAGNIVDSYIFVIEEIKVLNHSRPWWGIQEFFSNSRLGFLIAFTLILCLLIVRRIKKKKIVFFLLACIILFHYFNALPLERYSPYFADAYEYQRWGRTMLEHGVIGPVPGVSSTHWPPFWPFTLGILEYLYSDPGSIIYFMTFIQAAIVIFIYLFGAHFFSGKVGIMAALLFTIYPETLIRSKVFYSEPLFLLSTMIFFYFYLLFRQKRRPMYMIIAVVSFLAALHTKQEILLLWACIFPVEFFLNRKNLKPYILMTLLIIIGCLPYIYRNYRVTGEFVFISSTFGQNLLMGNCFRIEELEYGPYNQPYPYGDTRYTPEQLKKIRRAADALEVNELNTRFALEFLREVDLVQHLLKKVGLYLFWEGYPYGVNFYVFSVPWFRFVIVLGLSIAAFLILLLKEKKRRDILFLFAAPIAMNAAIALVFFLRAERHRYLAMPFLLLLISACIIHVADMFFRDNSFESRKD